MLLSLRMDQPYHRFVKRFRAFKFELRPNGVRRRQIRRCAGSCRFVYNKRLALQKARFDAGEKKLNYAELCGGQPAHTRAVRLRCMRLRGQRRSGWRDQYTQGGTRPLRL